MAKFAIFGVKKEADLGDGGEIKKAKSQHTCKVATSSSSSIAPCFICHMAIPCNLIYSAWLL